ncbi:MAG: hypothetical protein Q7S22_05475 [Candidatus Micrarchaeota archaeon]|nr:hypothetical protein [Candidatus Micrarchaeota archaeon]
MTRFRADTQRRRSGRTGSVVDTTKPPFKSKPLEVEVPEIKSSEKQLADTRASVQFFQEYARRIDRDVAESNERNEARAREIRTASKGNIDV